MSPVEILPPTYLESRLAAEAAKRRAQEEKAAMASKPSARESNGLKENNTTSIKVPTIPLQPNERFRPHNLTQAMLQRPSLSRPASSGFLGNVYQGFVRAAHSAPPSHHGSTVTTPTFEKAEPVMKLTPEMEKMIAEKKRDADIVCTSCSLLSSSSADKSLCVVCYACVVSLNRTNKIG